MALGNVVKAQGLAEVARRAHLGRSKLAQALRPKANPTVKTLKRLLSGIGLELAVKPRKLAKRSRKKAA
jgi:probable addiction module antidote protein